MFNPILNMIIGAYLSWISLFKNALLNSLHVRQPGQFLQNFGKVFLMCGTDAKDLVLFSADAPRRFGKKDTVGLILFTSTRFWAAFGIQNRRPSVLC